MKKIYTYTYNGIYIYSIDDAPHHGALKIGKFSIKAGAKREGLEPNSQLLRDAAIECIDNQTSRAAIKYDLLWAELALYEDDGNEVMFDDHTVHTVLENSGYTKREFTDLSSNPQEWYNVDLETAKKAICAVKDKRLSLDFSDFKKEEQVHVPEIKFRDEQTDAIELALRIFESGRNKVLWNAKMRFGKTLCALETVRRLGAKRTLLITHRPDVRTGWFTDFNLIKFGDKHFRGAKKVPASNPYNLRTLEVLEQQAAANEDFKYLFFASIQDLRGGKNVGGRFDKNEDIFQTEWDLLIIDEAHEGTQTKLGKKVIAELQKQSGIKSLYLSGTPYNILDDFESDEIFTWDYIMEQEAKARWYIEHPNEPNPYEELPRLNIFTYNLGNVFDYRTREDEDYFNFNEFFRVSDGSNDIPEGEFVHRDDVWNFLNLLCEEDTDSNYPYSTEDYRFALSHTLWVVGGVPEALALSNLINEHKLHTKYGYQVVNVAGEGDPEDEIKNSEALKKVNTAISENERTITLTCGRLTTGVTVREWTGVFMLAGSYNTRAATYLQTIFRCQSPSKKGVVPMKTECYAFDFAPDRTLVVIDEAIAKNTKGGTSEPQQRVLIDKFLNFCPVIAMDGSKEVMYDTTTFMSQVNRAYSDKIVSNGFKNRHLYTNLHTISNEDFNRLMEIGKLFSSKSSDSKGKGDGKVKMADGGLTGGNTGGTTGGDPKTPTSPTTKPKQTEKPRWERAMNVLNEISARLPMMIFGLGISSEGLNIDYIIDNVDDESWSVFMPKGLSKDDFRSIKHLYNDRCLADSARLISENTQKADEMSIVHRIPAIAHIIEQFRFPDKETVLTPWRVVNMHLADTVGGWCFYDGDYANEISEPRFVDTEVSKNIFANDSKVLEINSKSGLYPLYAAYSLFRQRLEQIPQLMRTKANEDILWREVLKENLYVVCMSPMAVHITNRVLRGNHTDWHTNVCYIDNLTNKIKEDIDSVVSVISNSKTFNDNNSNNNMKFTAIVGNPPYQINDGGAGASATPIYNKFIDIAKTISPTYISMITPSRWFAGGKGLDRFRDEMSKDKRIRSIYNFINGKECFPTASTGSINYFLWDKNYEGMCAFATIKGGENNVRMRTLDEFNVVIGDNVAISIINKVQNKGYGSFCSNVMPYMPFGLRSYVRGQDKEFPGSVKLYSSAGLSYYKRDDIKECVDIIDKYKILSSKLLSEHAGEPSKSGQYKVLSRTEIIDPNTVVTESYLILSASDSIEEIQNTYRYCCTKFFRFLLLQYMSSINMTKEVFKFVPKLDMSKEWTDKELYSEFGLTKEEIDYIESIIKPME